MKSINRKSLTLHMNATLIKSNRKLRITISTRNLHVGQT